MDYGIGIKCSWNIIYFNC